LRWANNLGEKTMFKSKIVVLVCALGLLSFVDSAMAGQALSWNLSRDMMTGITKNPKGVWAFMESQALHSPVDYKLFPTYSSRCLDNQSTPIKFMSCWQDSTVIHTAAIIGVTTRTISFRTVPVVTRGVPYLHPGSDRAVIIRWKSPVSGNVDISGRVSDIDSSCGDGINWFIDKQNSTLLSRAENGTGSKFYQQNIPVTKGQSLYFIIDRGNNNESCDSTALDLIITSQQ
jgi:hypothetical protein